MESVLLLPQAEVLARTSSDCAAVANEDDWGQITKHDVEDVDGGQGFKEFDRTYSNRPIDTLGKIDNTISNAVESVLSRGDDLFDRGIASSSRLAGRAMKVCACCAAACCAAACCAAACCAA